MTASPVLDDEAQSVFTPNSGGIADISPDKNMVTAGLIGALFVAGADGFESISMTTTKMLVIAKDPSTDQSLQEEVSWSAATVGDVTTWTATSTSYESSSPAAILTVKADGSYTFTMNAPLVHSTNSSTEETSNLVFNFNVKDGDGDVATASLTIQINDDTPTRLYPDLAILNNAIGATTTASLDIVDDLLSDNYGADGGTVRFDPALTGTNSGLTAGMAPILYSVSADGLTLTGIANGTTIFTAVLDPSTATYQVTMSAKIDSYTHVDFNDGGYNFVGGNNAWSGFIPSTESSSSPIDNNSSDLLLTPIINGANSGTINSNANSGGISSGASVGAGEAMRVDFITDLRGDPAGSGGYQTAANRDHVFDSHYTTNGASALFIATDASTVNVKAYDDPDGNNVVGDGVVDPITYIVISYYGIASAYIAPTTTLTHYTVNGHDFTVQLQADGSVSVGNVNGDQSAGTRIAAYTDNGYNSIVYYHSDSGKDTFKVGDFGTSIPTTNPINLALPVQIIDGDGDTLDARLPITLQPSGSVYGTATADTMNGTASNDYLIGLAANDILNGLAGIDYLFGGLGDDTLNGGAGNDILIGGIGSDVLTGGLGIDHFQFSDYMISGTTQVDTIKDFSSADGDKIVLDSRFLAELTAQQAITFNDLLAPTLIYDSTTGNLSYDADGTSGSNSAVLFASVWSGTTHPALTSADFLVI